MKKFIVFLFMVIIFVGFISAWSYDNSHNYGDAHVYAKVIGSYPVCDGSQYGDYCVGSWYIDVSHVGDRFYIGYESNNWITCDKYGCDATEINDGRIYFSPGNYVPRYTLAAWDYNVATNGDWAWTYIDGGYLGSGMLDGKKSVSCYKNSDCGDGFYCDKSGDWKTWNCKKNICNNGETKCEGVKEYECQYNHWIYNGASTNCGMECDTFPNGEPEEKCVGNNYLVCKDYKWENKSIMVGKCGVECLNNVECNSSQECVNYICEDENKLPNTPYIIGGFLSLLGIFYGIIKIKDIKKRKEKKK